MTKAERARVRAMFDGRCAYCGSDLGDRWHVDHVEPVLRVSEYVRGKGFVPTGAMERAANDRRDNLFPACAPCNIDKHCMPLESWREKLQRATIVLARNVSTYRHARRFGLIIETGISVKFYFERQKEKLHNVDDLLPDR